MWYLFCMADETDLPNMSMGEVDQMLFSEAPEPPQAPEPNITELLQQAGLQRQSPAPAEVPAEPEPAAEPAPEMQAEPEQPDAMQQFVAQQAQTNQQLLELQRQLAEARNQPQQQEPQFNINDPKQVAEYMEQIGLDPTDAAHHYMFRSDYENRQREAAYQQQLQGMNEYISYMQQQQAQQQAEQAVAPQVDSTLQAYGSVPAETINNIKAQAATLMSHGQYDQAGAIKAAVEPYLPLLRMLQQNQSSAQPQTQQPAQVQKPAQNTQAVLAAALSGRSTGHGPTVTDISLEDLEGKLFS